jgi:hypothetical protein
MNTWLLVRLVLIAAAFLQGTLSNEALAPPEGVSVMLLMAIFAFGSVGMLFIVGIQRFNPRTAAVWRYPAWTVNPFLLREPLQFFHLGGFFVFAAGAGGALRGLVLGPLPGLPALFLPAWGVGMLCGVYACTFVYRSKMAASGSADPL